MKIHNGFVSNSSNSSFLIRMSDWNLKTKLLTKKEESLLRKYGFKKTSLWFSDQIRDDTTLCEKVSQSYNYGHYVVCNQDEVILFLLTHNIPFEATCHYGHETVIYEKNSSYFLTIQNYGVQAIMHREDIFSKDYSKPIVKTNVKKWIKEQNKWIKKREK